MSNNGAYVSGDFVCLDCLKQVVQLFRDAVSGAGRWPAKWGTEEIKIKDFAQYIPDYEELAKKYATKGVEINTPEHQRLYCLEDGTFLGKKPRNNDLSKNQCPNCGNDICHKCGVSREGAPANHKCKETAGISNQDAFAGMVKGKDFQNCPRCNAKSLLTDGCNSLNCEVCGTSYCFICGVAVRHGDNAHWQRGGCPRFGGPESARPIHDDTVRIHWRTPRPKWHDMQPMAEVDIARAHLARIRDMVPNLEQVTQDDMHALLELVRNLDLNYGLIHFVDRQGMNQAMAYTRHLAIRAFITGDLQPPMVKHIASLHSSWLTTIYDTYTRAVRMTLRRDGSYNLQFKLEDQRRGHEDDMRIRLQDMATLARKRLLEIRAELHARSPRRMPRSDQRLVGLLDALYENYRWVGDQPHDDIPFRELEERHGFIKGFNGTLVDRHIRQPWVGLEKILEDYKNLVVLTRQTNGQHTMSNGLPVFISSSEVARQAEELQQGRE